MDSFERAAIDRLCFRGSVIGIREVCGLMRLQTDDNKSGLLNVEVVFSAEIGVRKWAFIGVFDFYCTTKVFIEIRKFSTLRKVIRIITYLVFCDPCILQWCRLYFLRFAHKVHGGQGFTEIILVRTHTTQ